jgi:hypothetical protein
MIREVRAGTIDHALNLALPLLAAVRQAQWYQTAP